MSITQNKHSLDERYCRKERYYWKRANRFLDQNPSLEYLTYGEVRGYLSLGKPPMCIFNKLRPFIRWKYEDSCIKILDISIICIILVFIFALVSILLRLMK